MGYFNNVFENNSLKGLFGENKEKLKALKLSRESRYLQKLALKQDPYRLNPSKQKYLKEEIKYLIENDFIEPSNSSWSCPCIFVPKPDGSYRMCTDYRKVNNLTKTNTFPVPPMDECIDKVGKARYVTKFDLPKGFWQVQLTDRAKEISAFVTPDGLFQYKFSASNQQSHCRS